MFLPVAWGDTKVESHIIAGSKNVTSEKAGRKNRQYHYVFARNSQKGVNVKKIL